jgi:hypothetical protein
VRVLVCGCAGVLSIVYVRLLGREDIQGWGVFEVLKRCPGFFWGHVAGMLRNCLCIFWEYSGWGYTADFEGRC